MAFRRGDTHTAYTLLLHHVEDLLDTSNVQGVGVAAIEFVRMMHLADRLEEVARLVRYLEASPLLESPYFRGLVSDAITASNPAQVAEMRRSLGT